MNEFLAADIVLIGAPMYNLNIPLQLKAWSDLVVVPGVTFKYGGKKAVILSSRDGMYGPGSPSESFDFQEKYLRAMLGFVGIRDLTVITAEGIALRPDKAAEAVSAAKTAKLLGGAAEPQL